MDFNLANNIPGLGPLTQSQEEDLTQVQKEEARFEYTALDEIEGSDAEFDSADEEDKNEDLAISNDDETDEYIGAFDQMSITESEGSNRTEKRQALKPRKSMANQKRQKSGKKANPLNYSSRQKMTNEEAIKIKDKKIEKLKKPRMTDVRYTPSEERQQIERNNRPSMPIVEARKRVMMMQDKIYENSLKVQTPQMEQEI